MTSGPVLPFASLMVREGPRAPQPGDIYIITTPDPTDGRTQGQWEPQGIINGPVVICPDPALRLTPLDICGPFDNPAIAGNNIGFIVRNRDLSIAWQISKQVGANFPQLEWFGEPLSPGTKIGGVFASFPEYLGFLNLADTDLSLGILGDPSFYINFGTQVPPVQAGNRIQAGSQTATGNNTRFVLVTDPDVSGVFLGTERGLHIVHNTAFATRNLSILPPNADNRPAIMYFASLTDGLKLNGDNKPLQQGAGDSDTEAGDYEQFWDGSNLIMDPRALGGAFPVGTGDVRIQNGGAQNISFAASGVPPTTASDVYVAVPGLTATTPEAGVYLVFVSGTISNSVNNAGAALAVFGGGVQTIPEIIVHKGTTPDRGDISFTGKVAVDGTEDIEVRWRRDPAAGVATIYERNMILLKTWG